MGQRGDWDGGGGGGYGNFKLCLLFDFALALLGPGGTYVDGGLLGV
jgi:hypothetical protein